MKNGKLNGKVAVVTGASKGIGAGIAKQFAAEGASVVVNYASSKTDADKVVGEITKRGGKAIAVQGNVAKKAEVQQLFGATKKAFGKIDILVNNAGVYDFKPLEEITEEEFHREFNTNVLGMMLATQEALKGRGRRHHTNTGQGTWPAENPRELHQSRHGGNGRSRSRWLHRRRHAEKFRSSDTARPNRPAGRCGGGRGFLCLVRFRMDHRRNAAYRGRSSLGISKK
jgi:NAD(P)-dependent dehydrogenase (short-subunit alcohol dehydrogenase family)